ncbi:MAG: D-alanyl-D-alanine carboxypeptidase/D-alanyl-D-alanine-endopeptidase [Thermodesulfobacteriota bacterium]|nr:D-alanyl-D-alanine carboxypeptidase/D-alanyl-D-alanine-endopeptidase [Thermodesulfobacteriota bacterium]
MSNFLFRLFCSVAIVCICCAASYGQAASAVCPSFSTLIQKGAYGVSDTQGNIISGCNSDTPYIPASILKIPTALAAFSILGHDYRFKTRFYTDSRDNLYIKGFGDPLLISEEVYLIIDELGQRGVQRINSIYIDTSSFALEQQVPGRESTDNPYDAPVGPVVVNFNSVAVRVTKSRTIVSGEPQTPTLPIMQQAAKDYLPGSYRINVCTGHCHPESQMARYTTELFRAMQKKAQIPGQGESGIKKVPPDAQLVYEHRNSKDLEYLTLSFLKYSSNFIANLVYLACGAEKFGYPATWAKANRAVHQELVKQLGQETASAIIQEEGAGLSRNNRITARTMLTVLKVFRPHAYLLGKRMGVLTKSGSMKGIYNYAGYLKDGSCYVIMLNQSRNTRRAVLAKLKKGHYPKGTKGEK